MRCLHVSGRCNSSSEAALCILFNHPREISASPRKLDFVEEKIYTLLIFCYELPTGLQIRDNKVPTLISPN